MDTKISENGKVSDTKLVPDLPIESRLIALFSGSEEAQWLETHGWGPKDDSWDAIPTSCSPCCSSVATPFNAAPAEALSDTTVNLTSRSMRGYRADNVVMGLPIT